MTWGYDFISCAVSLTSNFIVTMADEVINSLEKMKLTTEEEEVIAISEEGR